MPRQVESTPAKLEDQCIYAYLNYLHDEMNLIFHLKNFQDRSVLMRQHGLAPDKLVERLQTQLSNSLTGILEDIVRQKMINILISTMHNVTNDLQDMAVVCKPPSVLYKQADLTPNATKLFHTAVEPSSSSNNQTNNNNNNNNSWTSTASSSSGSSSKASKFMFNSVQQYRTFPRFQLFELILHRDLHNLDFSQNKEWTETDQMQEVSRTLWKIIGDKCRNLERFIVPKELSYSSTMNSVVANGANMTHLTLKRNVPNNMFLSVIGHSCPLLSELDIAGADIVTDFGVVCLLFDDPEQIFVECWNREKTVGSVRRSQRSFPHPHFDKPIPDPTEVPPRNRSSTQLLHLKKTFHDVIRDESYDWLTLPISKSLQKLRLENTKVKGDGASVVLECCPNLYSLGYLVFAAAGLKQVYGYEDAHDTKFTEIFYRGPSDQKLQTIANCCKKLKTMFLGSNSVRRLNESVFAHWPQLQYLTLENINVTDVAACLELIGKQLKGLKVQCSGFDMTDIALNCPNLVSLIVQKECPVSSNSSKIESKAGNSKVLFGHLLHLEITCPSFPKACFGMIVKQAPNLKTVKVFHLPGLRREDFEKWSNNMQQLETLIIFRAPEINKEAVDCIIDAFPNLQRLGDFRSFGMSWPNEIRKLVNKIKEENWNLHLVDSPSSNSDEADFSKLLSLHWFYLTDSPSSKTSDLF